jgi:alkanesulfonate monooxygenase SsuD/methylene tetrahydromethanopterin reductase-like flavin-dependent oxidoreductase (luciferase family)
MKLSLFYELQVPRPWEADTEHRMFKEALEQLEFADQVGFHGVWAVEHHNLEEYAHSSAPEIFLAAASQRTKKMRLGHGIMHTVPAINHPFRVAERISSLDLFSDGRVEFGSGEGASAGELGAFHVDVSEKRAMWREGLDVALAAMTEEPFAGWQGEYVDLPIRNVVPKPLQKPHPPLSMATSKRETIRLAAELGMGALTFTFVQPDVCLAWINEYYSVLAEESVPVGYDVNPNFALAVASLWGPTNEEALARTELHHAFLTDSGAHYYRDGEHFPGVTNIWDQTGKDLDQRIAEGAPRPLPFGVGDAAKIAADLRQYEEIGVDEILLMFQLGHIPHEQIMESIEAYGKEILPAIIERDQAGEPARVARKERLREQAMARKPEPDRPPTEGYSFGVVASGMKEGMDEVARVAAGEQARETSPEDVRPLGSKSN